MFILSDIFSNILPVLLYLKPPDMTFQWEKAFNIHTLTVLSSCGLLNSAVFGVMSRTAQKIQDV